MLQEIRETRQIPGEGFRRWFTDLDLDLVVWYRDADLRDVVGFQLSAGKQAREHALTWTVDSGFRYDRIDTGSQPTGRAMTPILVATATSLPDTVLATFLAAAGQLEPDVVRLVEGRIREYGRTSHPP